MAAKHSKADALDQLAGRLMLAAAIVFSIAFATILLAHIFERYGGYAPCPLCLQERYAYYFGVPASVVAFFAARNEAIGWTRIVLLLIAIGFLINAGLGVYHSGIEWKWWPGPSTCAGEVPIEWGGTGPVTGQLIRCDEAPWRLLWLSFAGWNAVISAAIAAIAAYGASQRR